MSTPSAEQIDYTERLTVPVGWWVVVIAFVLSLSVAVLFFLGPWWALGVTVVVLGLAVLVLAGYGAVRVVVSGDGLRVGRSLIGWEYVRSVTALDAERLRHRLGPGADPAAFLIVRPYLRGGVEITLDDPDDPHPYWVVSSRRATELARRAAAHVAT